MKLRNSIFFGLMILCISCTSESERFLEEKLSKEVFDFTKLKAKSKLVASNISNDGVEYGIITLKNNQQIKFWFVSHHIMSDKGGTIYEFPDGEKIFISGMHCYEVQFHDANSLKDLPAFQNYIEPKNGTKP